MIEQGDIELVEWVLSHYDHGDALESFQRIKAGIIDLQNQVTEEQFAALFGDGPEPKPPRRRTADDVRQEIMETEKRMFARLVDEPWLTYGDKSRLIRDYDAQDVPNVVVRRILWELGLYGLCPVWTDPTDVRSWLDGARALYLISNDLEIVCAAVSRATAENNEREPGKRLSLVTPHSFQFAVRDELSRAATKNTGSIDRGPDGKEGMVSVVDGVL